MLRHADDVKGQAASGSNREGESTEAGRRGGAARSSVEGPVMGLERRGCVVRPWPLANWKREEPVDEAKPFKATAEHREPCDSRESRTVLGAPGGEIPSGDSTTAAVGERPDERRLWAIQRKRCPPFSRFPSSKPGPCFVRPRPPLPSARRRAAADGGDDRRRNLPGDTQGPQRAELMRGLLWPSPPGPIWIEPFT